MARLACVTVSSKRTTMSPTLTWSPSRTRNAPTTPPVGCCTFLTFEATTSAPGATTAPAISVVAAHPPTPPARRATRATPIVRWRRIERRGSGEIDWLIGGNLLKPRTCPRGRPISLQLRRRKRQQGLGLVEPGQDARLWREPRLGGQRPARGPQPS